MKNCSACGGFFNRKEACNKCSVGLFTRQEAGVVIIFFALAFLVTFFVGGFDRDAKASMVHKKITHTVQTNTATAAKTKQTVIYSGNAKAAAAFLGIAAHSCTIEKHVATCYTGSHLTFSPLF